MGAVIGTFVFPILGTLFGGFAGGSVGATLGAATSMILASYKGFYGVLALPHFIQDKWHDFSEKLSSFFRRTPTATPQGDCSDERTPLIHPNSNNDSTKNMLETLGSSVKGTVDHSINSTDPPLMIKFIQFILILMYLLMDYLMPPLALTLKQKLNIH